ncbi:MAG TPA: hypothetical protein VJM49_04955, partial [Acidimicrobiales bacterium]|nr:hypothetical protein [Acidimicrobiales bacterium]
FLALVRLPVALVTDELAGQLARLSILVAYVLGLVFTVHLAQAARGVVLPRRTVGDGTDHDADAENGDADTADTADTADGAEGADDSARWRVAALVLAVAVSPTLFTGGWVTVYHETELWACTLAIASLACSFRLVTEPSARWAYGAGVAAALCTMTRAPAGVGVAAAALVAIAVAYRPRITRMVGPALVALSGGLVHAAVNAGRFGSATAIPVTNQVQTKIEPARAQWFADHNGSFFSLEFVPSSLLAYLRPDALRLERVVPFARFGPSATELGGVEFESNTPTTSLTVAATLLLILAVVGVVWAARHRRWAVLGIVGASAIAAGPTLALGFMANRYLVDFLPSMAAAAAVAVWAIRPARRAVARAGLAVLVAWGLLVNVALAVWTAQVHAAGFHRDRLRVDAAVFDAPSPGIVSAHALDADDLFGTLGVDRGPDGDEHCHGVYVVGMTGVSALERTQGDRRLATTVPFGDATIVDNGTWALRLHEDGDLVLTTASGEYSIGSVGGHPGDRVEVDVVVDPVTGERFASVGDEFAYLPAEVLEGRGLAPDAIDLGPLCEMADSRMPARD